MRRFIPLLPGLFSSTHDAQNPCTAKPPQGVPDHALQDDGARLLRISTLRCTSACGTSRLLFQVLDEYAIELKACHDYWTTEFRRANADRRATENASIDMEMAIEELQRRLRYD